MEKTYRFRARIFYDNGNPVLSLKSIKNPQPIEFLELTIPVIIDNPRSYKEDGIKYFLDFENSSDERNAPFGDAYNSKANQRNILYSVEKEVDSHIFGLLKSNKSGESISFKADSGFDLCCNKRYGNPRSSKSSNAPLIIKKLPS